MITTTVMEPFSRWKQKMALTKGVNCPYLRPWGLRGHLRNDFANFRDDLWQWGTEELATAIDPVFSKSIVNLLLD